MEFQDPGKSIQSLYLSLLGRAADPDGLMYWSDELENNNLDVLADKFVDSVEFQNSVNNLSSEEIVQTFYQNLFDRGADEDGLSYWASRIDDDSIELSDLSRNLINAASETDQEALNAKLSIADYYTSNVTQQDYTAIDLTFDDLHSNEELYADLLRLDTQYDTLGLEQVGSSLQGNPIYKAEVGNGPRTVMLVTQQHGDEPLGTEAALYLLEYLAGDSEAAQALREQVKVVVMPRVNPDGFARWEQQAAGEQDILDPRLNAAGVDLNRTYDPNEDIDTSLSPETEAVKQVVAEYQPEIFLDYHHQNNYRSDSGTLDTMSVRWATNEGVEQALVEQGQKAAIAIADSLESYDHDSLTLYPGSDTPAIGRNGLALDGTATLLIEQRGLQEMDQVAQGLDYDYSALASALTLEGFISMLGVITSIADGSFNNLDPALAQEIPERSESIDFADLYSDDMYEPANDAETLTAEEVTVAGIQDVQVNESLIA